MNVVPGGSQLSQPGRERAACQRALKREAGSLFRELANACEHHASGGNRSAVGIERRQPAGDHVGVDELADGERPLQHVWRDGRFPAPFGPAKMTMLGRCSIISGPMASGPRLRASSAVSSPTVCSAVP
jgi:hypothetical protein